MLKSNCYWENVCENKCVECEFYDPIEIDYESLYILSKNDFFEEWLKYVEEE